MPDDRKSGDRRPRLPALTRPKRPASRSNRLDTPVDARRGLLPGYDPESLGRLSERVARFLGTGRFILYMTIFVGLWLSWNTVLPKPYAFDPRSLNYTLLTLLLSLQASYAAPLILLAQNRQDDRDRVNQDADRRNDAQLRADLEFVAREVASLRMAVGEVATRDYVRSELRGLSENLAELLGLDDEAQKAQAESARRQQKKAARVEKARLEATAAAVADAATKAAVSAVAAMREEEPDAVAGLRTDDERRVGGRR